MSIKDHAIKGVVRFSANKLAKTFKDGIITFIREYMDNDASIQFARFLDTEIGEALVSFGLSQIAQNIPIEVLQENKYFCAFAEELATNGFALAIDSAYSQGELLFKSFVKPTVNTLLNIPQVKSDDKFRVKLENIAKLDDPVAMQAALMDALSSSKTQAA